MTTVAERAESATAKTGYLTAAAMVRDWLIRLPIASLFVRRISAFGRRPPGPNIGTSSSIRLTSAKRSKRSSGSTASSTGISRLARRTGPF